MTSLLLIALVALVALGGVSAGGGPHMSELEPIRHEAVTFAISGDASVTLNVSTALTDGAFVRIEVKNSNPQPKDWLGMYLKSADPRQTVRSYFCASLAVFSATNNIAHLMITSPSLFQKPLKWTDYLVDSFPAYNATGAVSLVFQVYNVREPIVFSLFSGGTTAPVVIAQSVNATFADPHEPLHPRVLPGVGASDGSFVIAWTAARSVKKPVRARARTSLCFLKKLSDADVFFSSTTHHSSPDVSFNHFAGADLGHHCFRRLSLLVQRHHLDDRAIVAVWCARHRVRIHGFGRNHHGRGARARR